jgi:hypothetical protein
VAEVVIAESAEEAGELASDAIAALIAGKPDAVLGLATGSSPLATYTAVARRKLDLSKVRGFALDGYVGLNTAHPQSYRSVIIREVVEPLGFTPSLVRVPGDDDGSLQDAGERYEQDIDGAGGIDRVGDRAHWAYRIQRAPVLVRLEHAGEEPRPRDRTVQRPSLRFDRRSLDTLPNPGNRIPARVALSFSPLARSR